MTDPHLPPCNCLACGTCVDFATGIDTNAHPKGGDFTICITCGHVMAFATDLTLRELTTEEIHEVAGDCRILAVQKARGMLRGKLIPKIQRGGDAP